MITTIGAARPLDRITRITPNICSWWMTESAESERTECPIVRGGSGSEGFPVFGRLACGKPEHYP
jgi:hypothetical protein